MANPRVFVSSTCYDLADVRDSLVEFISQFGFEAILSERGDVFYHPDLHTHESCIKEIENCQLFVLIIGGRFGGAYILDPLKSIVNAEYVAAKKLGVPIFTFVKRDVNEDHRLFVKNRQIADTITFPSIDKQDYSIQIFEFIDEVRRSHQNNAYFPFNVSGEILDFLRKQWAGMFFDFLQQRKLDRNFETTQDALTTISSLSEKIEGLVKNVLRQVDKESADSSIALIDRKGEAALFFKLVLNLFDLPRLSAPRENAIGGLENALNWNSYLAGFHDFEITAGDKTDNEGKKVVVPIIYCPKAGFGYSIPQEDDASDEIRIKFSRLAAAYSALHSLDKEVRISIVEEFVEFKNLTSRST